MSYLLHMAGADSEKAAWRLIMVMTTASLCVYLSWLMSILLLEQIPRLLLAVVSSVKVTGFDAGILTPGWNTRLPDRAPRSLFSLYFFSAPIWGLVLLSLGPSIVARLRGWLALMVAQCALVIGWRVALYLMLIASAGWFHPFLSAPFNGSAWASSRSLRLALGIVLISWSLYLVHRVFRRFQGLAGGERRERLADHARKVMIPVGILGVVVAFFVPPRGGFPGWIPVATAFVFLALSAIPAMFHFGGESVQPPPGLKGAVAVALCVVLMIGSLSGYGAWREMRRRNDTMTEFEVCRSECATLYIHKPLLEIKSRENWEWEQEGRILADSMRLGMPRPDSSFRQTLYRSSTFKHSITGSDAAYTVVPEKNEVHLTIDDAEDPRGSAILLMHRKWGKPACDAIAQAIARYAAGDFLGRSLEEYAARIVQEEGPHSLREVFGLDARFLSPIVRDVLGGAWVEQQVLQHGQTILGRLYREALAAGMEDAFARIIGTSWDFLEEEWRTYESKLTAISISPDEAVSKAPFHQLGMTLTQRGYVTGYGSDVAAERLLRLRSQGVNTITLVPYAGTRAPLDSSIIPFEDSRDNRVIRTLQSASEIGLHRVLKPQLSLGEEFVGNITFSDPARFDEWFVNYSRWMLHYARLASLYRVDCLVIGTELAGVTRYESSWRALIREIRRVYSGPLTYAAHWGREFEEIRFWDALDYIGVNMYYPLSDPGMEPRPDAPRVRRLAEMFRNISNRYGKRVVFTEVGFPNTASAADEPFRKTGKPIDLELQARCVRTVLQAFSRQDWFGGMNWWEWPTTGQSGSFYETFILSGNPAGDVITDWYSGMR